MKKGFIVMLFIAMFCLCACSSNDQPIKTPMPASASNQTMSSISSGVKKTIEDDLKSSAIDDVRVLVSEDEGKLKVSVRVDPTVTDYSLALNMEPTVIKLKEDLDKYHIELSEYSITAVFYKNGEVDALKWWKSSDLETGQFVSTSDGVSNEKTVAEVFEFCKYSEGDYNNMS